MQLAEVEFFIYRQVKGWKKDPFLSDIVENIKILQASIESCLSDPITTQKNLLTQESLNQKIEENIRLAHEMVQHTYQRLITIISKNIEAQNASTDPHGKHHYIKTLETLKKAFVHLKDTMSPLEEVIQNLNNQLALLDKNLYSVISNTGGSYIPLMQNLAPFSPIKKGFCVGYTQKWMKEVAQNKASVPYLSYDVFYSQLEAKNNTFSPSKCSGSLLNYKAIQLIAKQAKPGKIYELHLERPGDPGHAVAFRKSLDGKTIECFEPGRAVFVMPAENFSLFIASLSFSYSTLGVDFKTFRMDEYGNTNLPITKKASSQSHSIQDIDTFKSFFNENLNTLYAQSKDKKAFKEHFFIFLKACLSDIKDIDLLKEVKEVIKDHPHFSFIDDIRGRHAAFDKIGFWRKEETSTRSNIKLLLNEKMTELEKLYQLQQTDALNYTHRH